MEESKLRFGVGVLVISAVGVAVILTFLFGAFPTLLSREYMLSVEFPSSEGVSVDTPVLRDGVRIGRVSNIQLKPEGVLLTLAMDQDQQILREYIPRISIPNFVTGDSKLEFVKADAVKLASIYEEDTEIIQTPYSDGDYLSIGERMGDPFSIIFSMEDEMRSTMSSIREAGTAISQTGANLNQLVTDVREVVGGSDTDLKEISAEAAESLRQFQAAIRDVRGILNDPELRKNLTDSLNQFPVVLEEATTTLKEGQETFQSFQRVGDRFEKVGEVVERTVAGAEKTVQNVEKFTAPFGERGDEIVADALRTLNSLDGTLTEVSVFVSALNKGDGTIRRLIEDDELYWQVRRTVENIETASARLRPILDDVRVFSDKIARDPRQLGVRGAITQRPSGLGLK